MARVKAVLMLSVVVLAGTPAASAGSEMTFDDRVPLLWRAQAPLVEQLASAAAGRLDARGLADLQRALLRASDPASAVADPEFVFPSRAGDLDGDGKADVLTFSWTGDQATLHARKGSDGSALWAAEGVHAAIPADLDGDGTNEVLTLGMTRQTLAPGDDLIAQQLAVIAADGSALWSVGVPGVVLRHADYEGGVAADVEYIAGLQVIPDATGDGRPDVWVGTMTFAYAHVDQINEADVFSGRTFDGTTGAEVGRVITAGANALPWVAPAGDLSGDGLADAFSLTGLTADTGLLAARSSLGAVHWVREVPTSFAYMSVADVSGDEINDVLLQAFTPEGPMRMAFSGADGAPLWSRPDGGYIDLAGDIDGDGGVDLIQIDTPDGAVVASAFSGATGEALWGPASHPGPDGAWLLFCICADDLTADGIWDPLTAAVVFGEDVTVTVTTLDGADGSVLWSSDTPASSTFPIPIGADADADGAGDLGIGSSDGATVTLETRRGLDFAPLWATAATIEGFPLGFYGDDIAGDAGAELLLATIRFVDETIAGSAHALDRDGLMWTVP